MSCFLLGDWGNGWREGTEGGREGGTVVLCVSPEIREIFSIVFSLDLTGVAGMKKYVEENEITGKSLVAITSGVKVHDSPMRSTSDGLLH